ncbi:anti-sigma factor [Paenibacillus barengoltzii]|uniref:anti-sigma factor n=1 Tax=Paenibacillus barengoltzii TaxID=343517 RepID=UPI000FDA8E72|nr:anti-sigma factor [Paenibacillus barengoltzii]
MKCPEAVEWMHRYLDHDLNEEETSLLFEHMRSCEECAETFALLRKLSAQLEDLPKVVPNYSLVDAILPQLDEIDRARREGGSTAEDIVLPMTAVQRDADAGQGGMLPSRRSLRRPDAGTGMRRSRIYRYGALGVAAVLILGVFIYQYEPRTVSDAEIAMDTALESANKQSSATNSADDAASNAQLFSDDTNTGAPGAGDLDTPVSKDVVPPAEDPNTDGTQERIAPGDAPDSGSPAVTPGNSGTSDKSPSEPNQANHGSSGSPSVPNGGSNGAPAQGPTSPGAGNSDSAGDPETPDILENSIVDQQVTFDNPREKYGIASFNIWTSPDGAFEAEFKDGHLYVYRLEAQERKLVADQVIDGNWVDGSWSESGHIFTYETEIEGTPVIHTLYAEQAAADAAKRTQP